MRTMYVVLRNFLMGANLISFSLLLKPRKMVQYIAETLFLYKIFSGRGIEQKNVYEVLGSNDHEPIELINLKSNTWFYNGSFLADIISLCLICRITKPKIVFEIGTFKGYTALHFAVNTPDDTKIYTLDLPEGVEPELKTTSVDRENIKKHKRDFQNNKIERLFGDSATFDYSPFYGKVDFFFIDGSHSYEYVKSDTLNALKCCHPGSVIAWHDFGRSGVNRVSKWLLEFSKENKIYSIPAGSLAFMIVN